MHWVSTIRLITFVLATLFSIIVVALSADLIALTGPFNYLTFSPLTLSTGLLTILTIIPMFIVDLCGQGAFFSYTIVEIVWFSILWSLWLSAGSYAAWTDSLYTKNSSTLTRCTLTLNNMANVLQACSEIKAITAFSFLVWILLMAYTFILLGVCIRAHGRGHSPWTKAVRDGALFLPAEIAVASPVQEPPPMIAVQPSSPQQTLSSTIPYSSPPQTM
ncbi:hypothetical protein BGW80DRAFT_419996 [Lactifluus volemus]|nr:hypothetical protein BGW80DRAFT_419996 [Lactifluus volemus]